MAAENKLNIKVLDDEQVREIRFLYESGGYTLRALASMFGVSQRTIGRVVDRGKNAPPRAKLTVDQVHTIRDMYDSNAYTQGALAEMFAVSRPCISLIVSGKRWANR